MTRANCHVKYKNCHKKYIMTKTSHRACRHKKSVTKSLVWRNVKSRHIMSWPFVTVMLCCHIWYYFKRWGLFLAILLWRSWASYIILWQFIFILFCMTTETMADFLWQYVSSYNIMWHFCGVVFVARMLCLVTFLWQPVASYWFMWQLSYVLFCMDRKSFCDDHFHSMTNAIDRRSVVIGHTNIESSVGIIHHIRNHHQNHKHKNIYDPPHCHHSSSVIHNWAKPSYTWHTFQMITSSNKFRQHSSTTKFLQTSSITQSSTRLHRFKHSKIVLTTYCTKFQQRQVCGSSKR
jgi:hypothetical protein